MKICSIEGCQRKVYGRGLCNMHWQRWRKPGNPLGKQPSRWDGKEWPICSIDGCDRTSKGGGKGLCKKHLHKAWRTENIERMREHHKKYREENAESIASGKRRCYQAKKEYYNAKSRQYEKEHPEVCRKGIDELRDHYVQTCLKARGFTTNQITPELIKTERALIKLKRKIKEIA